jgi:hypothetical protein
MMRRADKKEYPAMANEEQVLRDLQDELVQRAEQLVLGLDLKGTEGSDKGKTQVSKALEVIQTAGSLMVFINWLRYQAGRERSAELWTKNAGQRSLAEMLANDLGWIQGQVRASLPELPKVEQDAVTMRAAARFLGYFRRAMIGAAHLRSIQLASKEGT